MAYQANKPQPTDQMSQSQADLLGNFQAIDNIVLVDHEGFASADAGKHKKTLFTQQAGDQVTAATEVALYAKSNGAATALYYRAPNNGAVTEISACFPSTKAAKGSTMLPSGIILQWGTVNASHGGSHEAFLGAFPALCASIQLTAIETGGSQNFVSVQNINAAGFDAYSSTRSGGASNTNCYYLAIGY